MTNTPKTSISTIRCPTCQHEHTVDVEPGHDKLVKCVCGKFLQVERGPQGGNPVVREIIQAQFAAQITGDDASHT